MVSNEIKKTLSLARKDCETSLIDQKKIEKIDFAKGIAILIASFPNLKIPEERAIIMHELLSDLSVTEFFTGIKNFCKYQKELYPGTNIVANIRSQAGREEAYEKAEAELKRKGIL